MKLFHFILLCLATFILVTIFSPYAHAQQRESKENPPELIVKYKKDQAPEDIKKEVDQRQEARKNFFGALSLGIQDSTTRLTGQKTPEEKKIEIETVKQKANIVDEEEILKDTKQQKIKTIDLKPGTSIEQAKKTIQALPEIEYAEENKKVSAFAVPNDPLYSQQWGYAKIQAELAWNITKGSSQIIVAVLDTGIDYRHVDIPQNVLLGPSYPYPDDVPMDYNGHGTHVAGTIGALTNNSQGVTGINWNVRLMAVQVLDDFGGGYNSDIIQGIQYAADNGARVINMSLGGAGVCSSSWQDAINYARSKGTTIVVAAGNSNQDAGDFTPASCPGVISVGATGPNDEKASYSNYGSVVDIAAPGGNRPSGTSCLSSNCILSTWATYAHPTAYYYSISGTSMASPHVSGVAALLLSLNPNLTPDQIENIIKTTGDPISDTSISGKRLNAYRAVLAVAPTNTPTPSSTPIPPTPTPIPGDINGDGVVNILDFNIWRCEFIGGGACSSPVSNKKADLNNDNIIDLIDFSIWRLAFVP